ncbi:MAG: TIGR02594 family protein [Bacteroidetes bacterium]|nr:TIGR02594 family protein [Bacteroidota bacterium]
MNNIIKIAVSQLGVSEIKGENDNPIIIKYVEESGIKDFSHDEIPWCSVFVNWCCKKAGLEYTGKANARSWLDIGININDPLPGDIVVFWRNYRESWQGHVAFFLGFNRSGNNVFVLGGNQNNMVSITEYSTEKILGFRRLNSFSSLLLPEPLLKKGSRGNEVVKLQNILNKLNYPCGKADGIFGGNTEKVLMLFQKDNMLEIDGIYGKETHECLYSLIQRGL